MAGSLCKPCEMREVEVWRRRGVSNVVLGLTFSYRQSFGGC